MEAYRRHDISDKVWNLLRPLLPGEVGSWGGIAKDNRNFINAVIWILRTGAPWRDLPPDYGKWNTVFRRFSRWTNRGIWDGIREKLIKEPDFEWLMIDGTNIKVHPHAAGARGGNQDMDRSKGGSIRKSTLQWMLMVCQSK
jgi:transposase